MKAADFAAKVTGTSQIDMPEDEVQFCMDLLADWFTKVYPLVRPNDLVDLAGALSALTTVAYEAGQQNAAKS